MPPTRREAHSPPSSPCCRGLFAAFSLFCFFNRSHGQLTVTDPTADESTIKKIVEAAGSYELVSGSTIGQLPVHASSQAGWLQTYKPLLLIAAYILIASVLLQVGLVGMAGLEAMETMRYFMAGFFLVFSFFKLLDLTAFADAYSGYDLLASRWRNWGLIYPFFELFLLQQLPKPPIGF